MESREGGGPREAGGGWGQAFSPPLPPPHAGLRPRLLRGARSRSQGGAGSEPREATGAEVGWGGVRKGRPGRSWVRAELGAVLTAASHSDAAVAATAAGASLPPPPGRGRGADPQRHLRRCPLLRLPRALLHPIPAPFAPHSSLSCQPSTAALSSIRCRPTPPYPPDLPAVTPQHCPASGLCPHHCTAPPAWDPRSARHPTAFSRLHIPTPIPLYCRVLTLLFR